jgi:hypothetical protein
LYNEKLILARQPTRFSKKYCTKIRTSLKKSLLLVFLFAWQNVTALNGDTSALVVTKNALAFKKDEDRALQGNPQDFS